MNKHNCPNLVLIYPSPGSNTTDSTLIAPDRTDSTFQASQRNIYFVKKVTMDNNFEQRQLVFADSFKKDLNYWKETDKNKLKRIKKLIHAIKEDPFKGEGKPKPLKYQEYAGNTLWAREIDKKEHRLLYVITKDRIYFIQARFHYFK